MLESIAKCWIVLQENRKSVARGSRVLESMLKSVAYRLRLLRVLKTVASVLQECCKSVASQLQSIESAVKHHN